MNTLVSAFGAEIEGVLASQGAPEAPAADPRDDAHLLNGPQHPEAASSQDEIDRLLASLG